ncbi:hypothetical protein V6N11_081671 [Hibiscus sabdariffa]
MAASTYPNSHVVNSDLAEAIACDQTLILLKDLGFDRAIMEGDSLIVISKLCSPFTDHSVLSVPLGNILRRTNHFSLLKFLHVKREGNKTTHLLARAGRTYFEPRIWIEEAPPEVELAASQDRWWVDNLVLYFSLSSFGVFQIFVSASDKVFPPFSPILQSSRLLQYTIKEVSSGLADLVF